MVIEKRESNWLKSILVGLSSWDWFCVIITQRRYQTDSNQSKSDFLSDLSIKNVRFRGLIVYSIHCGKRLPNYFALHVRNSSSRSAIVMSLTTVSPFIVSFVSVMLLLSGWSVLEIGEFGGLGKPLIESAKAACPAHPLTGVTVEHERGFVHIHLLVDLYHHGPVAEGALGGEAS